MARERTYPFVLSFRNPMLDPIQVWLNVLQSPLSTTMDESGTTPPQEKLRLPFTITLPTFAFSVAAFAEAWEYDEEDKDGMAGEGHEDLVDARRHALPSSRRCPAEVGRQRV
jgi:dynactin-4